MKATPPAVRRSEIVPPDIATALRLLAAAEEREPEFAILLRVLAATGARRGEVCALRWTDVDLDKRTLVIRHSIAKSGNGVVQKDTKTHASRRIALDESTVAILRQYRLDLERRAATIAMKIRDDAYVFSPDPDGGVPLHPDLVSDDSDRSAASSGSSVCGCTIFDTFMRRSCSPLGCRCEP